MKKIKFMLFAVAAMAAVSCAKEIDAPENQTQVQVNYVDMEFTAVMEPVTRTSLSDGNKVVWQNEDKVSVFDNSASPANTQFLAYVNGQSVYLAGTAPEASEYYALYPYRQSATISGSKISNAYLNPLQAAKQGTFNKDTAPMMGKYDGENMVFRNLASHIKFTLDESCQDVRSITLMGNDNELLTGVYEVEWNNGNPVLTPVANSCSTYATIRVTSGSIAAGDYYFTIFPTEFKHGFTIIISKTDGSQIARKMTSAVTTVSERNKIQPLKKMAVTDFTPHMNYFVKYNDGFDLEFGGLKFNKNTDGFTGGKLYSDTLPVDIRKDGVFFIMPGTSLANAGMSGWTTYSSLVIIGADASVRTDINFPAISANLTDGGSHLLWANLKFNMVSSSTAPIIRGNFGKFGDVVISDCSFPGIPKNFLNGDHVGSGQPHAVMDWNSFVIEDSELGFNSTGQTYLVMERGSVGSSIDKVTFDNNVFYCMKDITGIDFLLLHTNNTGKGLDVNEFTLTNNTLVFNSLNSNISTVHALNKFVCDRNIFISDYTVNSNLVNVYKPDATTNPGTYPTEGQCTSNFYFDLNGSTDFPLLANSTILAAITRRGHPAELSASPLSALWEPENGKFGAYTITPVDPSKAPAAGVLIGAQRSDMTEESANVDSPSADYNSIDLGAL